MRIVFLLLTLLSVRSFAQDKKEYVAQEVQLNLEGAKEIASRVEAASRKLNKTVSLAVVGRSGETLLIYKGDQVGPHNTEAARRKAYTALSTKTSTLELMRKSTTNPDTRNLAELPELLLLSGGVPLWKSGVVIGAIGVAGGGSPENDHALAQSGALPELGITTK